LGTESESYNPEGPEDALTTTSFAPPVDIYEDEHNITLKLEVPGIDEKDIDVRIDNNTLASLNGRAMHENIFAVLTADEAIALWRR
jgi:HSP20 family molecular chaperone IbpA